MPHELVSVGVICADVMVRPVDEVPRRGTLGVVPKLEMHLGGGCGHGECVCSTGGVPPSGRVGADGFGDYLPSALRSNGGCDQSETR